MLQLKILKKIKETTIWPSIPAVEAEVIYSIKGPKNSIVEGKSSKTILPKAEFELLLYIQNNPISEELRTLIEDYADEKYSAGSDEAAMAEAGEEL
jgi:hypothetical protein